LEFAYGNGGSIVSILVRYAPVPSSTTEQYDEVVRRLGEAGVLPAEGFDSHVAFYADGQLFVDEIWDSQEQFEAFGQRVMPLLADVALEHSGQPQVCEIHNIIKR
jgi:hypothetical protein